MRFGVRGIVVLVGENRARCFFRQAARYAVIAASILGLDRGRADDHACSESLQRFDLFLRHLVGHHEYAFVTADGGHEGKPHAGVSARGFNNCPAGLEQPAPFVIAHDVDGHPVFHRTTGVHVFQLYVNLGRHVRADLVEPDDRRVPDRVQHVVHCAFHHRSGILSRRKADLSSGNRPGQLWPHLIPHLTRYRETGARIDASWKTCSEFHELHEICFARSRSCASLFRVIRGHAFHP